MPARGALLILTRARMRVKGSRRPFLGLRQSPAAGEMPSVLLNRRQSQPPAVYLFLSGTSLILSLSTPPHPGRSPHLKPQTSRVFYPILCPISADDLYWLGPRTPRCIVRIPNWRAPCGGSTENGHWGRRERVEQCRPAPSVWGRALLKLWLPVMGYGRFPHSQVEQTNLSMPSEQAVSQHHSCGHQRHYGRSAGYASQFALQRGVLLQRGNRSEE